MRSPSYLEHGQFLASQTPERIATEPAVVIDPGAAEACAGLRIPLANIIDFAADTNGGNPEDLRSLGVQLVRKGSMGPKNGNMSAVPEAIGNPETLHFPVISLVAGPHDSIRSLNGRLRHELRHIFQECREEPYNLRAAKIAVRATSLAVASLVAIKSPTPEILNLLSAGTVGSIALPPVTRAIAGPLAWCASGQELDANMFRIRHPSYQPIERIEH